MNYCVVKNTTKVIDGSDNTPDIMLQNAQSAGFTESEVEILTEAEYQARKATEPKPPQPPTEQERIEALEQAMLNLLMEGMV